MTTALIVICGVLALGGVLRLIVWFYKAARYIVVDGKRIVEEHDRRSV